MRSSRPLRRCFFSERRLFSSTHFFLTWSFTSTPSPLPITPTCFQFSLLWRNGSTIDLFLYLLHNDLPIATLKPFFICGENKLSPWIDIVLFLLPKATLHITTCSPRSSTYSGSHVASFTLKRASAFVFTLLTFWPPSSKHPPAPYRDQAIARMILILRFLERESEKQNSVGWQTTASHKHLQWTVEW